MAINRRQFLKRSGMATAGALFAPSIFRNPFVQNAFASTLGDRYLLTVYLDGGNDGLNTVPPYDDDTGPGYNLRQAYEAARSSIRLTQGELAATQIGQCPTTGTPMALHPGMIGLKNLYDINKVAVIQGCGYPDYNLSHEESRLYWQTANPLNNLTFPYGWVGRYLEQAGYVGTDIPALCVQDQIAGDFQQTVTGILATRRTEDLEFPYDDFSNSDVAAKRACFEALYGSAAGSPQALINYIGTAGSNTLQTTDDYSSLADSPGAANYTGGISRDFSEAAKVINATRLGVLPAGARHFALRNGGYDTHSDQGGAAPDTQHYNLHREVFDAIEVFYDDCISMGVENKVLIMVYSEFSRRIEQNDSGTDHGSQGPVFVIGGGVTGGVYGSHPDIRPVSIDDNGNTNYSQAAGDFRSTDIRDIYGTILKHWLNLPVTTINNLVLPIDAGPAADFWTVRNYDMGFI